MNIWERLFGGGLKSPLASREAPARALQQPPTSEKEKGRNVTITPRTKKSCLRGSLILQFQNRLGNIFSAI